MPVLMGFCWLMGLVGGWIFLLDFTRGEENSIKKKEDGHIANLSPRKILDYARSL